MRYRWLVIIPLILLFAGCNERFGASLFERSTPHERYLAQLEKADLSHTQLYQQWKKAAEQSFIDPILITVPHQEEAYIHPAQPLAFAYVFEAKRGEWLQIHVLLKGLDSVKLFTDLFSFAGDTVEAHEHTHLTYGSVEGREIELNYQVRRDGSYLLRVQPEILAEVSFQLRITAEPSLADLVDPDAKQYIGSVFGDPRDGGARRHEGIDIFAARSTPVLAAIDGTISRVGDNRLGGKVVWLRPQQGDYHRRLNLYYAHLDSQLVTPGQEVRVGDTLGLLGNTGNARTTPPHLHFGIYSPEGAVDPLPFVQPNKSNPPEIQVATALIGDTLRLTRDRSPVRILAASRQHYRVLLPDGSRQELPNQQLAALQSFRTQRMEGPTIVFAQPDSSSARVTTLQAGETIQLIGEFKDFTMIAGPRKGWIRL